MKMFKLAVAALLILAFTIVIVQNAEVTTLQVFSWQITMSRIILLVLTLLVGFLSGYFTARGFSLKRKVEKTIRQVKA